jgi:hypothetical protein
VFTPTATSPQRKLALKRSQSEGNIPSTGKEAKVLSDNFANERTESSSIQSPDPKLFRSRRLSRSVDSFRKLNLREQFVLPSSVLQPDWAEISSSTASLENASNIQVDDDSASIGKFRT